MVALTGLLFGACDWSPLSSGTESRPEEPSELGPGPTVIPPGATIVTFTFADTLKNQVKVGPLFARYGMRSTFYVNSGRIGRSSGYLSLVELRALASAGHEAGGHTINHMSSPSRCWTRSSPGSHREPPRGPSS